jgi:hypothetical protein
MSLHNRLDKLLLLARAAAEVQRQRDALKRPTLEMAEVKARVCAALAAEDADLIEEIKQKTANPESPYMEPVFVQWLKWISRGYGSVPARIPRALLEGFARVADKPNHWPRVRCLNCRLLMPDGDNWKACASCGGPVEWGQFGVGEIFPSDRARAGQRE